jgi:predicted GNAT family N-acyltransferase
VLRKSKLNEWYLDKSVRGQGQGKRLMQLILNDITVNFLKKSIVLSAQVEVSSFYRSLGFITQGEVYDDGGSLTSSPSMWLDKKSHMHNSDPLPRHLTSSSHYQQ